MREMYNLSERPNEDGYQNGSLCKISASKFKHDCVIFNRDMAFQLDTRVCVFIENPP